MCDGWHGARDVGMEKSVVSREERLKQLGLVSMSARPKTQDIQVSMTNAPQVTYPRQTSEYILVHEHDGIVAHLITSDGAKAAKIYKENYENRMGVKTTLYLKVGGQ